MTPSRPNPYRGGSAPKLTPEAREQVLALVREGHSYGYISAQLGISQAYISTLARSNGQARYGLKRNPRA